MPSPVTSARSYLTTVLGEFVLPDGCRVWTSTLLDALGAVGVEERATRQAIARSADRGLLTSERIGRRTRWQLTGHAHDLLTEGTRRIYGLHHGPHRWDGRWLLVFVTVPESRRELRYRLRTRMQWAGFAPFAPGAWVTPWADRETEAREVLGRLGLLDTARSFAGSIGGLGDVQDVRRLVADAWDLATVADAYQAFIDGHRRRQPGPGPATFAALTEIVEDWRRFPYLDPDLPPELLPPRWAGRRAAALFHRLHQRWAPPAWEWWRAQTAAAQPAQGSTRRASSTMSAATLSGSWNGPK